MRAANCTLVITLVFLCASVPQNARAAGGDIATSLADAQRGDARAQYLLSLRYLDADGVPEDVRKARCWLLKSAAQKYGPSETQLGWLAEEGVGQTKSFADARRWYERAVDHGSLWGMNNLGRMYLRGSGVPVDYGKAYALFQRAWMHSSSAMFNLGLISELGLGRQKDMAEACAWYTVAAEKRNRAAAVARDRLRRQLSVSELASTQKRLRSLRRSLAWDRFDAVLSKIFVLQYLLDFLIGLYTLIYLLWSKKKRPSKQPA